MSGESGARPGGARLLVVLSVAFLVLAALAAWWIDRRAGILRRTGVLAAQFASDIRAETSAIDAAAPIPEEENAAVHYEAAFGKWRQEGWHLARKLDAPWTSVPGDLAAYSTANAAAMADAEKGAALEPCRFEFPPGFRGPGLAVHPYGPPAQCEGMTSYGIPQLFGIRARIHLEEGRTAAAAADAVRVPRVVRHALRRTVREAADYDSTIRHAGEVLERVLRRPDLDAATARAVAAGLLDWDRIDEDQAMQRRILSLLGNERLHSLLLGRVAPEYEADLRRNHGLSAPGLLPGLTVEDLEVLAARREKWRAFRERAESGPPPEGPPTPWMGKLTVLRAAFAIRARQLEKGAPPERLEDLVPDLLPAVSRDPWGTGPLRYEVKGDAWSVESVGRVTVHRWDLDRAFQEVPLGLRIDWPPPPEPAK